jgi:hypothetical protein
MDKGKIPLQVAVHRDLVQSGNGFED